MLNTHTISLYVCTCMNSFKNSNKTIFCTQNLNLDYLEHYIYL